VKLSNSDGSTVSAVAVSRGAVSATAATSSSVSVIGARPFIAAAP
jgi:hypothetical protein